MLGRTGGLDVMVGIRCGLDGGGGGGGVGVGRGGGEGGVEERPDHWGRVPGSLSEQQRHHLLLHLQC